MIKFMNKAKKCYEKLFKKCLTPTKPVKKNAKKKTKVSKESSSKKSR